MALLKLTELWISILYGAHIILCEYCSCSIEIFL